MYRIKMWQSHKGFIKRDDPTTIFLTEEQAEAERKKIKKVNLFPWTCPLCEKEFLGLTLAERDAHVKDCGKNLEKKVEKIMVEALSGMLGAPIKKDGETLEELREAKQKIEEKIKEMEAMMKEAKKKRKKNDTQDS